MTTQLIEAARQALNALDEFMTDYQSEDGMNSMKHYAKKYHAAITLLRAALEQPSNVKQVIELYDSPGQPAQDKPAALETVYETIIQWDEGGGKRSRRELARRIVALYTRPQAREPLTDEAIWRTYKHLWMFHPAEEPRLAGDILKFARAIEAAHGIKGEA